MVDGVVGDGVVDVGEGGVVAGESANPVLVMEPEFDVIAVEDEVGVA